MTTPEEQARHDAEILRLRAQLDAEWLHLREQQRLCREFLANPLVHAPRHGLELRARAGDCIFDSFIVLADDAVPEGEAHIVHGGRVIAKLVLS